VRRALVAAAAILAAVLLQVTVLNNVPFPGGSGPDLVLVVVVTLALGSGPRDGALIGFAAGSPSASRRPRATWSGGARWCSASSATGAAGFGSRWSGPPGCR